MVSKLVPGGVFGATGLNRHSTPTGPGTTPEELDRIYERSDFDGTAWPPDSPVHSVYDVKFTSTKMLILNNKYGKGFTRLRGYGMPRMDRKVEPERHFRENSPRNIYYHLRCYDSTWELLPDDMRGEVESAAQKHTLPDKVRDYRTTYRTLIPPHLRLQESFNIAFLRRLKKEQQGRLPRLHEKRLRDYDDRHLRRIHPSQEAPRKEKVDKRVSYSAELPTITGVDEESTSSSSILSSPCASTLPFLFDSPDSLSPSAVDSPSVSPVISTPSVAAATSSPGVSSEEHVCDTNTESDEKLLGTVTDVDIDVPDDIHHGKEGRERPKSRLGREFEYGNSPATSLGLPKERDPTASKSAQLTLMIIKEIHTSKSAKEISEETDTVIKSVFSDTGLQHKHEHEIPERKRSRSLTDFTSELNASEKVEKQPSGTEHCASLSTEDDSPVKDINRLEQVSEQLPETDNPLPLPDDVDYMTDLQEGKDHLPESGHGLLTDCLQPVNDEAKLDEASTETEVGHDIDTFTNVRHGKEDEAIPSDNKPILDETNTKTEETDGKKKGGESGKKPCTVL